MPPATAESERVHDPAELGLGDDSEMGVDFVDDSDEDPFRGVADTDSEPSAVFDDFLDPDAALAEQSLMGFLDAHPLDESLDGSTDFASPGSDSHESATATAALEGGSAPAEPDAEAENAKTEVAEETEPDPLRASYTFEQTPEGKWMTTVTTREGKTLEVEFMAHGEQDQELRERVLNMKVGDEPIVQEKKGKSQEGKSVIFITIYEMTEEGLKTTFDEIPNDDEEEDEESAEEAEQGAYYEDGGADGLDVETPSEAFEQEAPKQSAPDVPLNEQTPANRPAIEAKTEPASGTNKTKEATQTIEAEAKPNLTPANPEAPAAKSTTPPAPATPAPTAPKPEAPRPPIAPPEPAAADVRSGIDSPPEPAPSSFGLSGQSEPAPVGSGSGMEAAVPEAAPKLTTPKAKTPKSVAPKPIIIPRPSAENIPSQPQPSEPIPHAESTQASADETEADETGAVDTPDAATTPEPETNPATSAVAAEPAPAYPKDSPSTGPSTPDGGGGLAARPEITQTQAEPATPAASSRPETSTTTAPTITTESTSATKPAAATEISSSTTETPSVEATHVETASAPEISRADTSRTETSRTEASPVVASQPETAKVEAPAAVQVSTKHHIPAYTAEPKVAAQRVEAVLTAPETLTQSAEAAPSQTTEPLAITTAKITTITEMAAPVEVASAAKSAEIHTYPQAETSPNPQIVEPTITAQTTEPVIMQAAEPIVAQAVAPTRAEAVPMTFEDILAAPVSEATVDTAAVLREPLAQEPPAQPVATPAEITSWLEDFGATDTANFASSEAAHIAAPTLAKIETHSQNSPMPTERSERIGTDQIADRDERVEIDKSAEEDKADEVVTVVANSQASLQAPTRPAATRATTTHSATNLLTDASENKPNYGLFSTADPFPQHHAIGSLEAFHVPTQFAPTHSPTRTIADTNASSSNDADDDSLTISFEAEERHTTRPAYARATHTATAGGSGFGGDA